MKRLQDSSCRTTRGSEDFKCLLAERAGKSMFMQQSTRLYPCVSALKNFVWYIILFLYKSECRQIMQVSLDARESAGTLLNKSLTAGLCH